MHQWQGHFDSPVFCRINLGTPGSFGMYLVQFVVNFVVFCGISWIYVKFAPLYSAKYHKPCLEDTFFIPNESDIVISQACRFMYML